jgi:hypothetical protein
LRRNSFTNNPHKEIVKIKAYNTVICIDVWALHRCSWIIRQLIDVWIITTLPATRSLGIERLTSNWIKSVHKHGYVADLLRVCMNVLTLWRQKKINDSN